MSLLVAMVRRSLWLLLLAVVGGAAYAWWRDRDGDDALAPPEWPPLQPAGTAPSSKGDGSAAVGTIEDAGSTDASGSTADTGSTADGDASAAADTTTPATATTAGTAGDAGDAGAASSVINALVDAPEARSTDGSAGGWVEPNDDGSCPVGHPIKANDNSGIFHVPDGRFYERTRAERCYADPDAAVADGYRQAKN